MHGPRRTASGSRGRAGGNTYTRGLLRTGRFESERNTATPSPYAGRRAPACTVRSTAGKAEEPRAVWCSRRCWQMWSARFCPLRQSHRLDRRSPRQEPTGPRPNSSPYFPPWRYVPKESPRPNPRHGRQTRHNCIRHPAHTRGRGIRPRAGFRPLQSARTAEFAPSHVVAPPRLFRHAISRASILRPLAVRVRLPPGNRRTRFHLAARRQPP